ncbi:MAG: IclR family transcriptional regulator [Actinomycetota bacterium]|nr:IclR family transcriptional regulator [Actinomycetota bacterium]
MSNNRTKSEPVLVQSVDRAIVVLELLAREREVGITDIAAELGVHKSTASRIVYTLQARRLVEQHGHRGRFTMGIGMLRFAGAVTGQLDLARLGGPVCEALAEKLGETVNVAVLDGSVAINICQARGSAAVAAQNWIGRRTPLHATSSGKVLLAALDERTRESILAGELAAHTPDTVTDPDALRSELQRVARDGYAICVEELEPGLHAVAVPVRCGPGEVIGAVSASGPSYRLSRTRMRQIANDLRPAAIELSSQLGSIG